MKVGEMQGHVDIDRETIQRFNNLGNEIKKLGETLTQLYSPIIYAIHDSFVQTVEGWSDSIIIPTVREFRKNLTITNPDRWEDESLTEWADRLEEAGIWDDPDIRWMYQKECLKVVFFAPYRWIKGLVAGHE